MSHRGLIADGHISTVCKHIQKHMRTHLELAMYNRLLRMIWDLMATVATSVGGNDGCACHDNELH